MTSFQEQMAQFRMQKNQAFTSKLQETQAKTNSEEKIKRVISIMKKYSKHFDQVSLFNKAATSIQRFVRSRLLGSDNINQDEIHEIEPIYRLRISITSDHENPYHEENLKEDQLEVVRLMNITSTTDAMVEFKYCFDIKKLYPLRHHPHDILGSIIYLQAADHMKLEALWKNLNGASPQSVKYFQRFSYDRALVADGGFVKAYPKEISEEEIGVIVRAFLEEKEGVVSDKIDSIRDPKVSSSNQAVGSNSAPNLIQSRFLQTPSDYRPSGDVILDQFHLKNLRERDAIRAKAIRRV